MASQETELSIGIDNRNLLSKDTGLDKRDPNKKDVDENSLEDLQTSEGSKSDETLHALSGLYAQIIIVVAAILVFTELLHGPVSLFFFHGYVFTFLVGGGILCFIGAYISMLSNRCPRCDFDSSNEKYTFSTHLMKNLFFSDISIYLRIGSVVFGLGTLISSGLEIASNFTVPRTCMDHLNLMQPILRGLFSFFQMHFIFMNAKVAIQNERVEEFSYRVKKYRLKLFTSLYMEMVSSFRWFRHIALMHLVATNLAIWIQVMMWECAKVWLDATHHKHNSSVEWDLSKFNITVHSLVSDTKSLDKEKHKPIHKVHVASSRFFQWQEPTLEVEAEETEGLISYHLCIQNSTIGAIWEKAMPYLYPFNVQYCLVAAAILYITWSNLQKNRIKLQRFAAVSVYGRDPHQDEVNCAGSTRGLLLGLLILVAGIIVLILYFVLAQDKDFNILFLIGSLECTIFGISILASILGLLQIRKMRSKTSKEQRLTDILQRLGMLAVYIYGICNIIVGGTMIYSQVDHFVLLLHGTLMVVQACLQSLFIHQVTKKRLSPLNMDEKPGRQVVIFLVFSNIVLWILESFTTPNQVRSKMQLEFYGKVAWPVISRIILPFVIFYRFHSSVALMEAWRKSYKIKQN